MKEGSEFGRFIICITLAFFVNFLFMSDLMVNVYHAGYLRQGWNIKVVGYIVSLVIIYIISYLVVKPKPATKK